MPDEKPSLADAFKAVMEAPDCDCMGCRLRKLLEQDGHLPVVLLATKVIPETTAKPKEPKPHEAPRPNLLRRIVTWIIRRITP